MQLQEYIESLNKPRVQTADIQSGNIRIFTPKKNDSQNITGYELNRLSDVVFDGNGLYVPTKGPKNPGILIQNCKRVTIKNWFIDFGWKPYICGVTITNGVMATEEIPIGFKLGRVIGYEDEWSDPVYSFEQVKTPVHQDGKYFYHKLMKHPVDKPVRLINSRIGNRSGIEIKNCEDIIISGCVISNYGQMGIGVKNTTGLSIEQCIIENGRADGIHLNACRDVILRNNIIRSICDDGINIFAEVKQSGLGMNIPFKFRDGFIDGTNISARFLFSKNVIYDVPFRGIYVQSPHGVLHKNYIRSRGKDILLGADESVHKSGPGPYNVSINNQSY